MNAIGSRSSLSISDSASLEDIDLPKPEPASRDILVRIEAVSVNPLDTRRVLLKVEQRVDALGVHVHPLDVQHG
ncbi:hypothetical protein [Neorhizobium petrolearium]|uniref:hypothetical protein n=1 Tax=Neorhizobium petrolearium TaxID=515361 RepID=UPI003F15471E